LENPEKNESSKRFIKSAENDLKNIKKIPLKDYNQLE